MSEEKENNQKQNKNEECPLCKISEETIEQIKKATEERKSSKNKEENNSKGFLNIPWAIVIAGIIVAVAIIYSQGLKQIAKEKEMKVGDLTEQVGGIDIKGYPSKGELSSPVLMVEYSDFVCPFCGLFFKQTLPLIDEQYIKTGKVRFFYKDFIVVGGEKAAEAAHCAEEQGKFWEYHNLLFERQLKDKNKWSSPEIHQGYAKQLGLNEDDLLECFDEGRYQSKVDGSTQEGRRNGLTGTPSFFINGEKVAGAQNFKVFKEIIERELGNR